MNATEEAELPDLLQQWIAVAEPQTFVRLLAVTLLVGAVVMIAPLRISRAEPDAAVAPATQQAGSRQDPNTQWNRLTTVVETSIDRSQRAAELHGSALRQLDSTDYALHCLVNEMRSVMVADLPDPLAREPVETAAPVASSRLGVAA